MLDSSLPPPPRRIALNREYWQEILGLLAVVALGLALSPWFAFPLMAAMGAIVIWCASRLFVCSRGKSARLVMHGIAVMGTLERKEEAGEESLFSYDCIVVYQTEMGATHRLSFSDGEDVEVGDTYTVLYMPGKPQCAELYMRCRHKALDEHGAAIEATVKAPSGPLLEVPRCACCGRRLPPRDAACPVCGKDFRPS